EERLRNHFDVGVIGYTTDRSTAPKPLVGPVLQGANGTLSGRDLVSMVDLVDDPLVIEERQRMVDDGAGGLISTAFKLPVWYGTPPDGAMTGRPRCAALEYVKNLPSAWCDTPRSSSPPVVLHLTDGEANDGDPEPRAEGLKALSTQDGSLLLFNCYISD